MKNTELEKFTVLLSLYHKEKPENLKEALDSIYYEQEFKPSEIILVEDGILTKELYEVLDEYENKMKEILKRVPLIENVGLAKALNIGLANCSFDIVARMDTDDIAKKDRFQKQIKLFSKKEIYIVGSWIDEFEGNKENIFAKREVPEKNDEILRFAKLRCPFNHPTVVYRKSKILEVGGYDIFPEDYRLWMKLLQNGEGYNIQESLLFYRSGKEMYKRRHGWNYLKSEIKMQKYFYKIGFINKIECLKNILLRGIPRIVPLVLLKKIYEVKLTKNIKK